MNRRPSDIAQDRIGGRRFVLGGYDYDAQTTEATALFRSLRRTLWPVAIAIGLLAAVLAVAGKGSAAIGVSALLGTPVLVIVAIAELGAAFIRRRDRRR